ncbi:MAG: MFS transporter, partial [Trebonia sp.]
MFAAASGAVTVYLVAALAVQIRAALHLGADAFGLVIACYYAGAAVTSIASGRLAEAHGSTRVMRWGAFAATAILVLIGLFARTWEVLAGLLFVGGAVAVAMQNSTNQLLARRIVPGRQGLAFGVKQAAVPLSTTFAGITVPVLALTVGWRWAFPVAALFTLVTAALVPRSWRPAGLRLRPKATAEAARPLRPLVVLTVGFALGVFATSGLTAFVVTGAVMTGVSKAGAGVLFAVAGAATGCSRVLTGLLADRRGHGHLRTAAVMLATGTIGFVVLAVASVAHSEVLYVIGTLVAYTVGWGWSGLFNFAVVRLHPAAPGQASSVAQTGARVAGVAGPLVFGIVVAHASYGFAWTLAACCCVAATVVLLVGRRMHRIATAVIS